MQAKQTSERTVAICYHRKSKVKAGGVSPASPEMQLGMTNAKARELGFVAENYTDAEGNNSGKTEQRTQWQKARARLKDPDVAALIVPMWDRPVRNAKLLLSLADECDALGIRFVSCQDNIDTRSAAGRFQLTVIAAVGEYESNAASERRVSTIDYLRRERGRHYGLAPFGAERIPQGNELTLVPSTKTQPHGTDHAALHRVYEMYGMERESIYKIAERLNAEGWRFRTRWNDLIPWRMDDVRRVLYNHWLYSGYVIVGRAHRGDFEVIPGSHQPILPDMLTVPVAARFETHHKGWHYRREPLLHPLTGVLKCACGRDLRGSYRRDRDLTVYMHQRECIAKLPYWYLVDDMHALVRDHILSLKIPDAIQRETNRTVMQSLLLSRSTKSPMMERQRLDAAIDRLADLFAEGEITHEQYTAKKAAYRTQLEKVDDAESSDATPSPPAMAFTTLHLGEALADSSLLIFRDIVRSLYETITVNADKKLSFTPQGWAKGWA